MLLALKNQKKKKKGNNKMNLHEILLYPGQCLIQPSSERVHPAADGTKHRDSQPDFRGGGGEEGGGRGGGREGKEEGRQIDRQTELEHTALKKVSPLNSSL